MEKIREKADFFKDFQDLPIQEDTRGVKGAGETSIYSAGGM